MAMISEAIRKAHAAGIKIGICGQGPSNHPDFAAFLVREGIDSISLEPGQLPQDRSADRRGRETIGFSAGSGSGPCRRCPSRRSLPSRFPRSKGAQRIEDGGEVHEFLATGRRRWPARSRRRQRA